MGRRKEFSHIDGPRSFWKIGDRRGSGARRSRESENHQEIRKSVEHRPFYKQDVKGSQLFFRQVMDTSN
jgi:hypothetical protein